MIFSENRFPLFGIMPLKTVRLAGFRRLHPIIPDRTAFGAANEGEAHGDHAENQCQSSEHGRPTPAPQSYGFKSGIFKRAGPVSLSVAPSMMLFGIIPRARN